MNKRKKQIGNCMWFSVCSLVKDYDQKQRQNYLSNRAPSIQVWVTWYVHLYICIQSMCTGIISRFICVRIQKNAIALRNNDNTAWERVDLWYSSQGSELALRCCCIKICIKLWRTSNISIHDMWYDIWHSYIKMQDEAFQRKVDLRPNIKNIMSMSSGRAMYNLQI